MKGCDAVEGQGCGPYFEPCFVLVRQQQQQLFLTRAVLSFCCDLCLCLYSCLYFQNSNHASPPVWAKHVFAAYHSRDHHRSEQAHEASINSPLALTEPH